MKTLIDTALLERVDEYLAAKGVPFEGKLRSEFRAAREKKPHECNLIPTISTAHLTKEVGKVLTEKGDNNPWVACASWEYGWFLYLDDVEEAETEGEPDIACLYAIRDWLVAEGFDGWVRLDGDGPKVPGLPTYDE